MLQLNEAICKTYTSDVYHKHQFIAIQYQGMSIHIIQHVNFVHSKCHFNSSKYMMYIQVYIYTLEANLHDHQARIELFE